MVDHTALSTRMYDMLKHTSYECSHTEQQIAKLGKLRYNAYLEEKVIDQSNKKYLIDEYDYASNTVNITVYHEKILIGGIRLHVLDFSMRKSPCCTVYPEYIYPYLESGNKLLEMTRFVLDPRKKKSLFGLQFAILRAAVIATEIYEIDYMIAPVRRKHFSFYRKFGNFLPICEPRPYPTLNKPLGLLIGDVSQDKNSVLNKYPFFCSDFIMDEKIDYPKIDGNLF